MMTVSQGKLLMEILGLAIFSARVLSSKVC
jgi:hypothetical protein